MRVQVQRKARALAELLAGQPELQRRYAAIQLASKLISQCEVQVRRRGWAPVRAS